MEKLKAVFYARVSTEEEKQLNALGKQCDDLKECIINNNWEMVDSYIDEGKSGTTTKKRDEYKRLCDDLETDKFDIIVIKSQDRLMRNVMDWYIFVDKLVTNGKKLYIYMENSFYKTDDSLLTGIKAILAAEYSRDLSKKLNNAHKRREQLGSSVMTNGSMIGYDQVNGELVINEEEAKIVRKVFDLYINGYGTSIISKTLADEGILNKNGNPYGASTLIRMIKNEKYIGTMICNKFHKDFDTKRVIKNSKNDWIIHENRIPPIISKDTFYKAQKIRESKSSENDGRKAGKRGKTHILSTKLICGECGSPMSVFNIKKRNGNIKQRIMCLNFCRYGRIGGGIYPDKGCNMPNGDLNALNTIIEEIINNIAVDEEYLRDALENIKNTNIDNDDKKDFENVKNEINRLKKKRELLLEKYLDGIIKEDIYISKSQDMDFKFEELTRKYDDLEKQILDTREKEDKIKSIIDNIKSDNFKYETFIDMLEKIVVYRDCIYFYIIGINKPLLINKMIGYGRKHTSETWRI